MDDLINQYFKKLIYFKSTYPDKKETLEKINNKFLMFLKEKNIDEMKKVLDEFKNLK